MTTQWGGFDAVKAVAACQGANVKLQHADDKLCFDQTNIS
jgi:hypothetical protein